jgi:hypothetical protein
MLMRDVKRVPHTLRWLLPKYHHPRQFLRGISRRSTDSTHCKPAKGEEAPAVLILGGQPKSQMTHQSPFFCKKNKAIGRTDDRSGKCVDFEFLRTRLPMSLVMSGRSVRGRSQSGQTIALTSSAVLGACRDRGVAHTFAEAHNHQQKSMDEGRMRTLEFAVSPAEVPALTQECSTALYFRQGETKRSNSI